MCPRRWVEVQLYSSMTAALEGGEWSAARLCRTLPPVKTRYPIYRRLCGPQGRSGRAEKLASTGIRSPTVQPVVSRYTDWATGPSCNETIKWNIPKRHWVPLLVRHRTPFMTRWGRGVGSCVITIVESSLNFINICFIVICMVIWIAEFCRWIYKGDNTAS